MKTSRPPGRSSRAASGTHVYGSAQSDAPYSETARSNAPSGSGTDSPGASTSGNSRPVFAIIRRAVSSCAGVMSTPVTRAPRFASQAPKYAVPQPSSITSFPETSPSAPISDSGPENIPHSISSRLHASGALPSVYSALAFVHASRLRSASSACLIGEPQLDLALRRLGGIGAVHEVVGHREGEVAADRPGRRVGRVRRTHRRPHRLDGTLAFDDEGQRRPRRDEVDELAEERLLGVLSVVLFC